MGVKNRETKEKAEAYKEITLVSLNNNGVFDTEKNAKGKEINTLQWEDCRIYLPNGMLVSKDVRPKFHGLDEMDYLKQLKKDRSVLHLEPMSAHEDISYLKNEKQNWSEIAELKMDGHRGTLHIGEESNRAFSRRISDKTDWYNENSDQVPHIRDLILPELKGTVIDGEFDYGTTSMGVQSVMGALPANAIQFQYKNGFIKFFAFDILYYKGINVQKMPLWKRKVYLMKVVKAFEAKYGECGIEFTHIYAHLGAYTNLIDFWADYLKEENVKYNLFDALVEKTSIPSNYRELFKELLEAGYEGLMIKDVNTTYEQKKTKNMIKLKGVSTWDCVIMGLTETTKIYDGKSIETWKYWLHEPTGDLVEGDYFDRWAIEDLTPVSKPYFMGWCGGIQYGVWKDGKLVRVGDAKGIKDKVLEDLKENGHKYVAEQRVVEIKANGIVDMKKGSLRHPRFVKWRDDKDSKQCTWNDHIREIWE